MQSARRTCWEWEFILIEMLIIHIHTPLHEYFHENGFMMRHAVIVFWISVVHVKQLKAHCVVVGLVQRSEPSAHRTKTKQLKPFALRGDKSAIVNDFYVILNVRQANNGDRWHSSTCTIAVVPLSAFRVEWKRDSTVIWRCPISQRIHFSPIFHSEHGVNWPRWPTLFRFFSSQRIFRGTEGGNGCVARDIATNRDIDFSDENATAVRRKTDRSELVAGEKFPFKSILSVFGAYAQCARIHSNQNRIKVNSQHVHTLQQRLQLEHVGCSASIIHWWCDDTFRTFCISAHKYTRARTNVK